MTGFLQARGLRIQQHKICEAMRRVNPAGVLLQALNLQTVHRRRYQVRGPLALWHIDDNHKMTRWKFAIHGGIDDHSRMILALQHKQPCSRVLSLFQGAVRRYGLPSRVRSHKQGGNVDVALFIQIEAVIQPVEAYKTNESRGSGGLCLRVVRMSSINYFTTWKTKVFLMLVMKSTFSVYTKVYLPTINRRLSIFTAGNDNGLTSSERNFTPLQLWVRGLLHLQQPHLRAAEDAHQRVRFVLGKPVLNNYLF